MGIKSKWLQLKDYLLDILIEKESFRLINKGLLYRESSNLYHYDENTHQIVFRKVVYNEENKYTGDSTFYADILIIRGCVDGKDVFRNVTFVYNDVSVGEETSFEIGKFEYLLELIHFDWCRVRYITKHV